MELRALWAVLVRWRWVVLIVTIGSILASGALAVISPPGYKASTILSFSAPPSAQPATIPGLDEQNRFLSAEQVVDDFTKIVPSYGFATGVAKRLSFQMDPRTIEKVWTIKKQAHHLLSIEASGPTEARAVELAFLFNYLDDRIRDADQVELLGLHVIGVIPHANASPRSQREPASIITS